MPKGIPRSQGIVNLSGKNAIVHTPIMWIAKASTALPSRRFWRSIYRYAAFHPQTCRKRVEKHDNKRCVTNLQKQLLEILQ
jgi:hypothetical protein